MSSFPGGFECFPNKNENIMGFNIYKWSSSLAMKPILSWFRSVLSKGQMKMYLCDKISALWRVCHFLHPLNKAAVWFFFFFQPALWFVFKTFWGFRPLVIQLPEWLEQMCSASRNILMQPGHWFTPQWKGREMNIYWLPALHWAPDVSFHLIITAHWWGWYAVPSSVVAVYDISLLIRYTLESPAHIFLNICLFILFSCARVLVTACGI